MEDPDSVYENSNWQAIQFEDTELSISTTKSIVARGQFGASFMLGKIHPYRPVPPIVDAQVTMKICKETDHEKCYNGLKSELSILYDLCHSNVIRLIGFSSDEQFNVLKFVLVFEYCSNGNLIKLLQKGRPYYNCGKYSPKKAINNEVLCGSPGIFLNICGWHLLRWTTEIARGMEYLAFKGVVHGDLSARNVLLTCDWTAKICNFGIAKRHKIQEESYAQKLPKDVLPIAWMAPETIQNSSFSEASDVYSFGITLWEIYTLGDIPYSKDNITLDSQFWIQLLKGIRPPRPSYANDNIWNLMSSCWQFQSHNRPTFIKIKTFLERTVLASKSDMEEQEIVSGHECISSNTDKESAPTSKKKGKSVTFAPPNSVGFFRKYFGATDDLFLSRLKAS